LSYVPGPTITFRHRATFSKSFVATRAASTVRSIRSWRQPTRGYRLQLSANDGSGAEKDAPALAPAFAPKSRSRSLSVRSLLANLDHRPRLLVRNSQVRSRAVIRTLSGHRRRPFVTRGDGDCCQCSVISDFGSHFRGRNHGSSRAAWWRCIWRDGEEEPVGTIAAVDVRPNYLARVIDAMDIGSLQRDR
jgi:hypothetical protein